MNKNMLTDTVSIGLWSSPEELDELDRELKKIISGI